MSATASPLKLRVITNLPGLESAAVPGVDIVTEPWPSEAGGQAPWQAFRRSFGCDYILLNGSPHHLLVLALLKLLAPFNRCRIVALDILLSRPRSGSERVKTSVRGWLLRRVHRILLYYRDTSAIQQHLGLPASKFDYVPFKINQFDLVTSTPASDAGYIFCGGKTRRDFTTLIAATAPLGYPVKIVTTPNEDIARHGSYLEEGPMPPNIEVVRLDGSARPFIESMAASRLVVLPLKPDITGVGIGVYIMAMALGKPVVITAGPSTHGLLGDDLAIVVPPNDADALRDAIARVYTDAALRQRLADNGRAYALALGDERQLVRNVAAWLADDARGVRREPAVSGS
jgi:glycosyltransferase involved in cell wall biosynthesis